jgi:uncharacterized protein DUF4242
MGDPKKESRKDPMNTYAIRREQPWQSPAEIEAAAERSRQIAAAEFPGEIRWIRSYLLQDGAALETVSVYQATHSEVVRRHAERVGIPAAEVVAA